MTLIDQIRDMISEGETEKSLEELYTYVKENNADIIDQLVMLRNRNRNLQRSVQMGTMDAQDAGIERAKINEAILKLLPQLTPEYLAQASKRVEREPAAAAPRSAARSAAEPAQSNLKYYLIGGGAVLLLLLFIGMCNTGEDEVPASNGVATEAQALSASDNIIDRAMAAHDGTAVWQASYSGSNGTSTFQFNGNATCSEIKDGALNTVWKVTEVTADEVILFDSGRSMTLALSDSEAHFMNDGDTEWHPLFKGQWITPNR